MLCFRHSIDIKVEELYLSGSSGDLHNAVMDSRDLASLHHHRGRLDLLPHQHPAASVHLPSRGPHTQLGSASALRSCPVKEEY